MRTIPYRVVSPCLEACKSVFSADLFWVYALVVVHGRLSLR